MLQEKSEIKNEAAEEAGRKDSVGTGTSTANSER